MAVTEMGKDEAAKKPGIFFFLAHTKRERADKYIRAITNGLL